MESLARSVDVVSIHSPLIAQTHHMFNEKLLGSMRRGSYIVNTARAEETDQKAIVAALDSGQLAGYAGDVWFPQPPPKDHPWRTMPNNAMTRTYRAPRCRRRQKVVLRGVRANFAMQRWH